MSKAIMTRGAIQCKSHHQKMLISHGKCFDELLAFGEAYCPSGTPFLNETDYKQVKLREFSYQIWRRGSQMRIIIDEESVQTA
jgi:hypothetical protein